MSDGEISVERAQLARESKRFGEGGTKALSILKKLDAALSVEGKCWGQDATGKGFETKYIKPKEGAENSFVELSKKLDAAQSAIEGMAKNYDNAEYGAGG